MELKSITFALQKWPKAWNGLCREVTLICKQTFFSDEFNTRKKAWAQNALYFIENNAQFTQKELGELLILCIEANYLRHHLAGKEEHKELFECLTYAELIFTELIGIEQKRLFLINRSREFFEGLID